MNVSFHFLIHYAEGPAEAQRGLALAQQANNPSAIEIGYLVLAQIYCLGGDLPRMLEASRSLLAAPEASHGLVWVNCGYCYLAWAQSCLGHPADALENMRRARTIGEILQGTLPRQEWLAAVESVILLNAQQLTEAHTLAENVVGLARSVDSVIAEGVAQRVWAQSLVTQGTVRWDEVQDHLATSLRLFEAHHLRLEAAHTHVAWGQVLKSTAIVRQRASISYRLPRSLRRRVSRANAN